MSGFFPARVAVSHFIMVSSAHIGSCRGLPGTSGMHVQPLAPWRSALPRDIPSFAFAGQSITAACSVMLAGPALSAFAIFHSSECADVVNLPGANGVVAVARSSAQAIDEIVARLIAPCYDTPDHESLHPTFPG